jgi:hypothetical protein
MNATPSPADLIAAALALRDARRYDEALELARAAVAADPQNPDLLHDLGGLLTMMGRPAEAEPLLREALALRPGRAATRHALALTLAALARYPEAWSFYGARHELPELGLPAPTAFPFPQWTDQDPAGKRIVIFPEQGAGDQIQFARFVPPLQAMGADVTLLARPPLARLFAHSFPQVNVVAAAGQVEFPDPDLWTMSAALVGHLGATIDTLPTAPYLRAPARWSAPPPGFKIGLKTRGNPTQANDANRSLTAPDAERLASALPGQVVSLEPADTGARDFADTAAILEQLDLVVTVDTSVAHLAGALGRPCFVLITGFGADWRWLLERTDSPWYPSLRLYRRGLHEDWGPAIARLARDVEAFAMRP